MERTYVTTSLEVARVANRKHGQVLRDIERLRVILPDTKAPEFEAARRTDAKGNSLRYYLLTPYALPCSTWDRESPHSGGRGTDCNPPHFR